VVGRWDIQPAEVQSVLARTQTTAEEFEGQMTRLNSALEGAAGQSSSDIVAKALVGFATEAAMPRLQFVFTRTATCLNAAAQAVNAYLDGDLQMAAHAQAAAVTAPDTRSLTPRGGVMAAR
jgi:Family of unknown function (DUF6507)